MISSITFKRGLGYPQERSLLIIPWPFTISFSDHGNGFFCQKISIPISRSSYSPIRFKFDEDLMILIIFKRICIKLKISLFTWYKKFTFSLSHKKCHLKSVYLSIKYLSILHFWYHCIGYFFYFFALLSLDSFVIQYKKAFFANRYILNKNRV